MFNHLCADLIENLAGRQRSRPKAIVVPDVMTSLGISDTETNTVYRIVALKEFADDVIKCCRRGGVTAKQFNFDFAQWQEEKNELEILSEKYQNKLRQMNQIATDAFEDTFSALMHLKVMRAYIDGVLRFGIEPSKFTIAVVMPRKSTEKSTLLQMTDCLAEPHLKEMYGEKMDAGESDDYWPFVCITLTTPAHLFNKGDQQ